MRIERVQPTEMQRMSRLVRGITETIVGGLGSITLALMDIFTNRNIPEASYKAAIFFIFIGTWDTLRADKPKIQIVRRRG